MDTTKKAQGMAWAVVAAGGSKYLCKIAVEDLWDPPDWPIQITDAWAYLEMDLPVQGPQGMAIQHLTHCRPVNQCSGPSTLWVTPFAVHFFSDMTEEEQKRNKGLVDNIVQATKRARAEQAGIQLAGPGALSRLPKLNS